MNQDKTSGSDVSHDKFKLPYWDKSLTIEKRVEDLLGRMTLEEKAGAMFHDMITIGENGTLAGPIEEIHSPSTEELVKGKLMNHFNLLGAVTDVEMVATWYNRLQTLARETRLGIPITLSSDPRHAYTENVGTSFVAGQLSQWPEFLGLAALRSPELVQKFGDIVRQEYNALGIRVGLHPQIDLATEYRWARSGAGFGEDADLTSELVTAYIKGLQGEKLGTTSVSAMTKHFPGGGPQKDGEDPHFIYGREQVYPGNNREYHLKPFKAAIAAGTSQMMPYYGQPVGTDWEEVGFAFSKQIITKLLREELGFKGILCTDWGLITDTEIFGQDMPARAWGVESLSEIERAQRLLEAGCDQYGGESRPELVIKLVQDGIIPESRLDISVARLLHEKFVLGLFEQPFVDPKAARAIIVDNQEFRKLGLDAQRRSYTLLKNQNSILPLKDATGLKFYVEGIDAEVSKAYGLDVVQSPEDADIALLRLKAPYEKRPGGFEKRFHAGSLEYDAEEKERQAKIYRSVKTSIVDIYLDRAAVIPELAEAVSGFFASWGSSQSAFLDVVFGKYRPEGKLPFDLPRSMDAVRASRSDMPYDTKDPLFKFGDGLSYN